MVSDIRKLIKAVPFVPFTIHTTDGGELHVPTVDHIAVPPVASRVFVFADDGKYDVLPSLHIAHVTVDGGPLPVADPA